MFSFSIVAFSQKGDILGDATVSGCPSSAMEKVHFPAESQHMEAISGDWEPVVWSPQTYTYTHKVYVYPRSNIQDSEHTQRTMTVCVSLNGCEFVRHSYLKHV